MSSAARRRQQFRGRAEAAAATNDRIALMTKAGLAVSLLMLWLLLGTT